MKFAKTHGQRKPYTPAYRSWTSMIQRCTNPNNKNYRIYGARGITVCEHWLKFESFFADMGERPPGTTLGRINNDGPYCLQNCRWETNAEQSSNRRDLKQVTFNGETKSLSEWARNKGISVFTLFSRLSKYGWTVERALTTPAAALGENFRRKAIH